MVFPNTTLQTGVDYRDVARAGAFNPGVPNNVDTKHFGTSVPANTILGYGSFVARNINGGIEPPLAGTTTVALIAGVVAYLNNGVMEDAGIKKGGLYTEIPVLNFGRIFVPVYAGATLMPGDTLSLNIAAGPNFNTVRPLPLVPGAGDLNISSIATVASPSASGLVEITFNQYIQ